MTVIMSCQVGFVSKLISTNVTLKRFLSFTDALMHGHPLSRCQHLSTELAWILPSVWTLAPEKKQLVCIHT
jgi:hypothetical protein